MSTNAGQETWKNVLGGPISVRKLDHRGELSRKEMVVGGAMLHITPEERRLNSQDIPVVAQDFFKNGSLVPVKLLDGSEDAREMASSPNLMAEGEMAELLDAAWPVFEQALADIDNPVTLQRLYGMAMRHPDCSHRKVETVKSKLERVAPLGYVEVTATSTSPGGQAPSVRAVTPR